MARHNEIRLRGQVWKAPNIKKDEDGNYSFGICYIQVVRGARNISDGNEYLKTDVPIILTRDPKICAEMENWKECDIVDVYGNFTTKNLSKASYCTHCEEEGVMSKNSNPGVMAYINPIFAEKIQEFDTRKQASEYLAKHKEISNKIFFMGNLTRNPKKIKTKKGVIVTQYQIAANRKYRIKTDEPENKTDYPWVKSYGDNAIEDRKRLSTGSLVLIDGIIQARTVYRTTTCACCGREYKWRDKTMEIVPYTTEYLKDFKTDEEIAQEENVNFHNRLNNIYGVNNNQDFDEVPDDEISEE